MQESELLPCRFVWSAALVVPHGMEGKDNGKGREKMDYIIWRIKGG